jgi:hypothetical protein
MTVHRAIVWINGKEARILRVEDAIRHDLTILATNNYDPRKHLAGNDGTVDDLDSYFHQVARALDVADELLIVGPSATRLDFVKYMHKNNHAIDPRILGVETIGKPGAAELAGFAKLYFKFEEPLRSGNGSGHALGATSATSTRI